MAWNREISMQISNPGAMTGIEINQLHVDFEIERTITLSGQSGNFTIYNAREETRKEITQKGSTIIFKAGYTDEGMGTIFIGQIVEAGSVHRGGDWITSIKASAIRGEGVSLEAVNVSLSYGPGTLISQPLGALSTALGLSLFGSRLARITLPNGFTFVGSARQAINKIDKLLEESSVRLYIDNSEIIVYNDGSVQSGTYGSSLLNYDSGLLEAEDITQADDTRRRIRFSSILIPKMRPNGLVTIQSDRIRGTFVVDKLTFKGNNYGGSFNIDGEAAA